MTNRAELFLEALRQPSDAITRYLSQALRELLPGKYFLIASRANLELRKFHKQGHCQLDVFPEFENDWEYGFWQDRVSANGRHVWFKVNWQGHTLEYIRTEHVEGFHSTEELVIVADTREIAESFFETLSRWSLDISGAVLVFANGCWTLDSDLFDSIKNATFDNLVLPEGDKELIQTDIRQWLESKDLYEQHGIPWKRGVILVGPPGNGKTHTIKAIVNKFDLQCLYVRSFESEYGTDQENIKKVFDRARAHGPCALILEDLDTLVTPQNRSLFLNELDGFAANSGILAIATANHPERLDPALVNRPSRFDRRYAFELPSQTERKAYILLFTSGLGQAFQVTEDEAGKIAAQTEGFSYAYLKELVLSSMMAWVSEGQVDAFVDTLAKYVEPLSAQIEADPLPTPEHEPEPLDPRKAAMKRAMAMRRGH